jgi:hypothetical protein
MKEPQKIFFDGKLIGEVPATDNLEKFLAAASALLQSKGHNPLTPDQAIFRQAASFATTASYLFNNDLLGVPRNPMSMIPFVVNASFALELYLDAQSVVRERLRSGTRFARIV